MNPPDYLPTATDMKIRLMMANSDDPPMTPPDSTFAPPHARWDRIRTRLEANAEILSIQGGVVSKPGRARRIWAVRLRDRVGGKKVHRSIRLGADPALRAQAEAWLRELRAPLAWAAEVRALARRGQGLADAARGLVGETIRAAARVR